LPARRVSSSADQSVFRCSSAPAHSKSGRALPHRVPKLARFAPTFPRAGSQASDTSRRRKLGRVTRDRWFESGSLQQRVFELSVPDRGRSREPTPRRRGAPSAEPIDANGAGGEDGNFVAAFSRWSAAMPQPNDLSRSLVALDQNSTIIAVVELSH